jgi:16S rRNA (guanine527-N7)-methyltransferase
MELIKDYFPELTERQIEQFQQLGELYKEWNQKINVISRKDIDNVYDNHILHSMAIARFVQFLPGAEILDLGTGGGLPGIPMAILFPETKFTLIDGTRKKITVVQEIIQALDLKNAKAMHMRAEELKGPKFDFVICRAVASLDKLINWSFRLIKNKQQHIVPNGLITLKGGNLKEEVNELPKGHYIDMQPLSDFFEEEYFEEKFVVYAQY